MNTSRSVTCRPEPAGLPRYTAHGRRFWEGRMPCHARAPWEVHPMGRLSTDRSEIAVGVLRRQRASSARKGIEPTVFGING